MPKSFMAPKIVSLLHKYEAITVLETALMLIERYPKEYGYGKDDLRGLMQRVRGAVASLINSNKIFYTGTYRELKHTRGYTSRQARSKSREFKLGSYILYTDERRCRFPSSKKSDVSPAKTLLVIRTSVYSDDTVAVIDDTLCAKIIYLEGNSAAIQLVTGRHRGIPRMGMARLLTDDEYRNKGWEAIKSV